MYTLLPLSHMSFYFLIPSLFPFYSSSFVSVSLYYYLLYPRTKFHTYILFFYILLILYLLSLILFIPYLVSAGSLSMLLRPPKTYYFIPFCYYYPNFPILLYLYSYALFTTFLLHQTLSPALLFPPHFSYNFCVFLIFSSFLPLYQIFNLYHLFHLPISTVRLLLYKTSFFCTSSLSSCPITLISPSYFLHTPIHPSTSKTRPLDSYLFPFPYRTSIRHNLKRASNFSHHLCHL